jgi:hypothetical protein
MTTPYLLGHLQNTACSVVRTQLLLFVLSDGNTQTMNEWTIERKRGHHTQTHYLRESIGGQLMKHTNAFMTTGICISTVKTFTNFNIPWCPPWFRALLDVCVCDQRVRTVVSLSIMSRFFLSLIFKIQEWWYKDERARLWRDMSRHNQSRWSWRNAGPLPRYGTVRLEHVCFHGGKRQHKKRDFRLLC